MKFCAAALLLVPSDAFLAPFTTPKQSTIARKGYLDDLSQYIAKEEREEDDSDHSVFKATDAEKDRFGVGDWSKFVDFDEFDGGDGQMGVAGDGQKGLEKEWEGAAQMAKSRTMSAKNAWGKSTGYAEQLRAQGMDTARAQQLENWQNQQEVLRERKQARWMTEEFDKVTSDEDWRSLAKFGVERNQVRGVCIVSTPDNLVFRGIRSMRMLSDLSPSPGL